MVERRHHIILCVFFIVGVRVRGDEAAHALGRVGTGILVDCSEELLACAVWRTFDPVRDGDRVTGEPSRGNKPPNVFLKSS